MSSLPFRVQPDRLVSQEYARHVWSCRSLLRRQRDQARLLDPAAAGVVTPVIDAVVEIVRSMTGRNFTAHGRTLERLGLSGMNALQDPASLSCSRAYLCGESILQIGGSPSPSRSAVVSTSSPVAGIEAPALLPMVQDVIIGEMVRSEQGSPAANPPTSIRRRYEIAATAKSRIWQNLFSALLPFVRPEAEHPNLPCPLR